MLKISKENLCHLFTALIANSIKPTLNGKGEKIETYWEELLVNVDVKNERAYINIHFIYHKTYRNIDFEGQEINYSDNIDFGLSGWNDDSREELELLENETHIDKNALYRIIHILRESV